MSAILTIQSHSHTYTVEEFANLGAILNQYRDRTDALCLVDQSVLTLYENDFRTALPRERVLVVDATEPQKSFEALTPIFIWLLKNGLRRDGCLLVVGGGVLQDIGCFIASVLFRGLRWELVTGAMRQLHR
jgi:3-dehydroquinate synthase